MKRANTMIWGTAAVALLGALSLAPAALAAGAPSDRDAAFERVLNGFETVPTRVGLERAFPDARARLLAAATDASRRDGWPRQRAITLLNLYRDAGVRAALEGLSGDALPRVRRMAVYTLGRSFGQPGDAKLVETVKAAVADPEPDVRDLAVRALRWIQHPAARATLASLAKSHPDSGVRRLAKVTLERWAKRWGR